MKTKKILLALLLAALTASAACAADVALTSIGQGPDAMMIKVIMRSLKITPDYEPLMKPEALTDQKVLVAVVGGSSKGLGAAGISEADETARAEKIMAAIKQTDPAVIMAHLGGSMRRGTLSDKLTDMVLEVAKYMVVVEDANFDGKFTQVAQEKNIPLTYLYAIKDGMDVFSALFNK